MKRSALFFVTVLLLVFFPKPTSEYFSTDSMYGWSIQPRAIGFGLPFSFVKLYLQDAQDVTAKDSYSFGSSASVQDFCREVNKETPNNLSDCYIKAGDVKLVNDIRIFLNAFFLVISVPIALFAVWRFGKKTSKIPPE